MKLKIISAVYHRNGTSGTPFYAILFSEKQAGTLVSTLFQAPGHCAVLSLKEPELVLSKWRGDVYEVLLRPALATFLKVPDPFA